jgi:inorganic pyrophosphatase
VKVFIQNEAGSFVKHLHHEKTLEPKGDEEVTRAYPYPYGFILDTTAEDGDNVDCFVLTHKALRTGQIVECEATGLMEQIEDGQVDHNVLATLLGEDPKLTPKLEHQLTEFVRHVFDRIPGENTQTGAFLGKSAAAEHIAKYRD